MNNYFYLLSEYNRYSVPRSTTNNGGWQLIKTFLFFFKKAELLTPALRVKRDASQINAHPCTPHEITFRALFWRIQISNTTPFCFVEINCVTNGKTVTCVLGSDMQLIFELFSCQNYYKEKKQIGIQKIFLGKTS